MIPILEKIYNNQILAFSTTMMTDNKIPYAMVIIRMSKEKKKPARS